MGLHDTPHSMLRSYLTWACTGPVHAVIITVSLYVQLPYCVPCHTWFLPLSYCSSQWVEACLLYFILFIGDFHGKGLCAIFFLVFNTTTFFGIKETLNKICRIAVLNYTLREYSELWTILLNIMTNHMFDYKLGWLSGMVLISVDTSYKLW